MARKIRSDCTVDKAEENYGIPHGAIRNPDGRDARGDKKIGNLRKEYDKENNKK